jgi:hypothetical protein
MSVGVIADYKLKEIYVLRAHTGLCRVYVPDQTTDLPIAFLLSRKRSIWSLVSGP